MEYLYNFGKDSRPTDWRIVDDEIMGGYSQGGMRIDEEGNCIFTGHVSLRDGGGFSSAHLDLETKQVSQFEQIVLRIKGDDKRYRFRIKSEREDDHFYTAAFLASSYWKRIEIPMREMHPVYRGKALKQPNYPGEQMEEVAILIANGNEEDFRLMIDYIGLQ